MKNLLHKSLPHIIALVSFLVISIAFYSPAIFGKKLKMGDIKQWKGMSKEIRDFRQSTGEEALWTNSQFGGMPATQIHVKDKGNHVKKLDSVYRLWLPSPISVLFKAMLGFYILLMCMRVNPVVGAVSAISFGLSSIFILYLGAGHATKMNAITYIAPMLGGILYSFRRHALKGALIAAFFLALHLAANHLQMTYYALFLVGIVGIGELIRKFRLKEAGQLPKTIGLLLVAALLGILPNYTLLSTTAEYGEYSTRGKSELTISADDSKLKTTTESGLKKDYILEYSMANGEWFSAYAPNVKGGKTNLLTNIKEAKSAMSKTARDFSQQYQILSYWGEQGGTAGAFYFGALMFFLAICALIFLKDEIAFSLLAVALISVLASWKLGSTPDFFLENIPLWNKFRDTKMMLTILMIIIPFLGALFLNKVVTDDEFRAKAKKPFLFTAGGFALLNIILLTSPSSIFDFLSSAENTAFEQLRGDVQGKKIIAQIVKGRQAIFTSDLTRSFIIFLLGVGALFLAFVKRDLAKYVAMGIGLIFIVDMWSVNTRYFDSSKDFQTEKQALTPFKAERVEKEILEREKPFISDWDSKLAERTKTYKEATGDTRSNDVKKLYRELEVLSANSNFRVLNIGNPFSDARTSYFHKSIGGYHGAKLKIYAELIDFHLQSEVDSILSQLQTTGNFSGEFPILSMLNTRYMIGNPDGQIIPFANGKGNAWFVKSLNKVENADEEIASLSGFSPENEAVIQKSHADNISKTNFSGEGKITLTDYTPNHLTYEVDSSSDNFAVFSEIYYPAGWNAFIDDKPVSHVKVNYVLRGLEIPAGTKKVEFKFEPQSYYTGKTISTIGSILLILLCIAMLITSNKNLLKQEELAEN